MSSSSYTPKPFVGCSTILHRLPSKMMTTSFQISRCLPVKCQILELDRPTPPPPLVFFLGVGSISGVSAQSHVGRSKLSLLSIFLHTFHCSMTKMTEVRVRWLFHPLRNFYSDFNLFSKYCAHHGARSKRGIGKEAEEGTMSVVEEWVMFQSIQSHKYLDLLLAAD